MPTSEVCTTRKAAQILGISVTSVQQLVGAGVIEAWKTQGGHRRIPLAAVLAYKAAPAATPRTSANARQLLAAEAGPGKAVAILVIEDNKIQRGIYATQIASWKLPAQLTFCENGYQALIEIASHKPNILLTDIVMDGIDGYEVIKTILAYPDLADMNIAMLSSLTQEDLAARGGVPAGVVFFGKPVNYDELRGYLRACIAQQARHSDALPRRPMTAVIESSL